MPARNVYPEPRRALSASSPETHPAHADLPCALPFLSFQQLPTVKICNPCVLITIRIAGGGWGPPLPFSFFHSPCSASSNPFPFIRFRTLCGQRTTHNPFPLNHFRTLSRATEGGVFGYGSPLWKCAVPQAGVVCLAEFPIPIFESPVSPISKAEGVTGERTGREVPLTGRNRARRLEANSL